MNETILNLAIRTAVLLKSSYQEPSGAPQAGVVTQYFGKLGFNPEDMSQVYSGTFTEKLAIDVCTEINNSLGYTEKVYLLLLVQDCLLMMHDKPGFTERLNLIFNCVGINSSLIDRFREFLLQDDPETVKQGDYLLLSPRVSSQDDMLEGRWIEDHAPKIKTGTDIYELEDFSGHLLVMFVDQIKSYVIRCLNKAGRIFDQDIEQQCRFRLLGPGSVLSMKGVPVITFSDLKARFLQFNDKGKLTLSVDQVKYQRSKGVIGIQAFTATETTGQLIGIVGREGVGKSTLLNLLAGKLKPDSGSIAINGYDLWRYKYLLKGTIGFVPEDDLLLEELSVADNLALTARLYYSHLNKKEIDAKVNAVLSKMDLLELKHVVVGNVLSKHIQPGQRRMINIALELLREPQILLVDNAISGLGMSDAAKVIRILHDYSFSGNLVITTISQADSSTFMLFDKIWIFDEGGRAVYNGSVQGAPEYLYKSLKLGYQEPDRIDPSLLLDLVNYKLPEKEGQVWKRVVDPAEWHDQYIREQILKVNGHPAKSLLPARILKIPTLEIQLLIFSIRNFKCKFSRAFNIVRALATGPLIAFLVSWLFRFSGPDKYTLLDNFNLPAYQFISVVVAVFLGLILSADEIIRERNILEKEEYLEFSRFSYLNSKILYLFPVVALQTFLYVGTGNLILGIKELFWVDWLIMFSVACFGILLGLVFSASINNKSVLYKVALPLVMSLQLLLGGGLLSYDRLNLGNNKYTPVLGDLMVSKWGYEALAVEHFKRNRYNQLVYEANKKIEQASFYAFQVVPKLEETLVLYRNTTKRDSSQHYAQLLQNELLKIATFPDVFPFEYINRIPELLNNESLQQETSDYLTYLSMYFYELHEKLVQQKTMLMDSLAGSLGAEQLTYLKTHFHNAALETLVTSSNADKDFLISSDELIRYNNAIYQEPSSDLGRARLFLPVKMLNSQKTETLWFNTSVIWLMTSVCYLLVLFNAFALIRSLLLFKPVN